MFEEIGQPAGVVVEVKLADFPRELELWARSHVGSVRSLRKNIEKVNRSFVRNLAGRREKKVAIGWQSVELRLRSADFLLDPSVSERWIGKTPFYLSCHGPGYFTGPSKEDPDSQPVVVVTGNALQDYCLFYNLSRLKKEVYWLLPEWVQALDTEATPSEDLRNFLSRLIWHVRERATSRMYSDRGLALTSASLTQSDLRSIENKFVQSDPKNRSLEELISTQIPFDTERSVRNPRVVFEVGNANNVHIEQFLDGVSVNLLPTPKPRHFLNLHPIDHHWVVDVRIQSANPGFDPSGGYILPAKSFLSDSIFLADPIHLHYNTGYAVRLAGDGVSFLCPTFGLILPGETVDEILVRPRIRLLDSAKVFERIFKEAGHTIELSDKGRFAQFSCNLFGSLHAMAGEFQDEKVRMLLDCFLDTRCGKDREGQNVQGVFLNDPKRVYVKFCHVKTILNDEQVARDKINTYVEKGILLRGFIFQCRQCRNARWYQMEDIGQTFTCQRCHTEQFYRKEHWKEGNEPVFYYSLNEILYQGYKNGMLVPVLTLAHLARNAARSFMYVQEIEVKSSHGTDQATAGN